MGHRPHKFPWKDNEADPRCIALKETLARQIATLAGAGVTEYFTGGADGTDCWAAEIVLDLREKNPALNKRFIYLFYVYEYTVAVFRHTRRGHRIPLQMVVSHHVVAGN